MRDFVLEWWKPGLALIVALACAITLAERHLMPHGGPDWFGSEPTSTVHMVQDVGELAVRLGSLVRYHRAGNVVFADSFQDGLVPFNEGTYGTGAEVYLTSAVSRSGAYAVELVAGSDGDKAAEVYRYEPYPGATVVGFEVSLCPGGGAYYFQVHHTFVKDGQNLRARVRYDHATGDLYYYDSLGTWQKFDTITTLYTGPGVFHPFKLTVDLEAGTYGRFYLDDDSWDLSDHELYSDPLAVSDLWGAFARIEGPGGSNPIAAVDDFVMTQNEP